MLVPRIFPYFIEICLIRNSAYFSAFYRKRFFMLINFSIEKKKIEMLFFIQTENITQPTSDR
jgi:hypothetical protein